MMKSTAFILFFSLVSSSAFAVDGSFSCDRGNHPSDEVIIMDGATRL